MPPTRPYYLLDPSELIPEFDDKPLLGRFVTSIRHPIEYPKITDHVDEFVRIIDKYGTTTTWETDRLNTTGQVGVAASAQPLFKAVAERTTNQVLDVSDGKITVANLRDPESAFKELLSNHQIKETVDGLLDQGSKIYMITGYKIANSGFYSRTIGGSGDVSVAITIPNPAASGNVSISPSLTAGTKSHHEAVQNMKVSRPTIYAIRYHVVRRPFAIFKGRKQADLRNVVVHSVADGTYGTDELESEDESMELYLSDLSQDSDDSDWED